MVLHREVLILVFLTHWTAAVVQGLTASEMTNRSQTTITFPRVPPDFRETAKKLMNTCSVKGFKVPGFMKNTSNSYLPQKNFTESPFFMFPELLSSVSASPSQSSNRSSEENDLYWNITEKMQNSSNMGSVIELMKNTMDSTHCFYRAFVAPLSWTTITQNGSELGLEDLNKLLWASKPLLETIPPSSFQLPVLSQTPNVAEMMKMFSEVFSSLSEEQRNEILDWSKERVAQSEYGCILRPAVSSLPRPKPANSSSTNPAQTKSVRTSSLKLNEDNGKEKNSINGDGAPAAPGTNGENLNKDKQSPLPVNTACLPTMVLLKSKVLKIMGPFTSRLSLEDVKTIPKEELCDFFRSPNFSQSFSNVGGIRSALGHTLYQRLKLECSSLDNFTQSMERLGSLLCFLDTVQSFNATLSKKLLSQLKFCGNSEIETVKRQLVQKILEKEDETPSREMLQTLGSAVSSVPFSKLSTLSREDLNVTLDSLSQAKWKPAQAKTLARKLLEETKNITGEKLLSLGSVVRGVDSSLLKTVKTEGMLGSDALKNVSEKMSSLQRKALLEAFHRDANASELVKGLPDSLLSSLPLVTLEKADLRSVDQLQGHNWTRSQSTFLLKKILGNSINITDLRKLGQAVQGLTCNMMDKVNRTGVMEMVQTLNRSSLWLSRTQIRCAAQKLFTSLEEQRPGYFSDIKGAELQAIPAMMLIQLPAEKISNLSDSVCPAFMEKMSQVNLSSLPNSAPGREALTRRAIGCLKTSVSKLSSAEVLTLGPLLCELDPAWISSLNFAALNATLQALASCQQIPLQNRGPLYKLITDTYGNPSNWSEITMRTLGPLLQLNSSAVDKLSANIWLTSCLSDLLDALTDQPLVLPPPEFRSWFDLSALRRKLFELKTTSPLQSRRKREVTTQTEPSLANIENLGPMNVYWSSGQLSKMSVQTFKDAFPTLGDVSNFSAEQLTALKAKLREAWGGVSMLNETQVSALGCISQSFSAEEISSLNISSLDTLETLTPCNFSQPQRAAVWQAFMKSTGLAAHGLGTLEMVGLGQFICGLQPAEIDHLNSTRFREAVEVVGRAACIMNVTERLKEQAVAAFGKPENWTEAQVSIMGNILAGLNAVELGRLNLSILPFIQSSAIPLIPTERLVTLSLSQMKALGPDNAAAVTDIQRAGLRADQKAALDEAVGLKVSRADLTPASSTSPVLQPLKGAGAGAESMMGSCVLFLPLFMILLGNII